MERKSMGSFIAALRKANGLTQKDLAEKLNVSDKSVSRWERDEGAPDLSLIPVIAEIFGITSDELLRGERKAASESEQTGSPSPRAEKQRRRLLALSLSKYKNRSLLAVGLAFCGLIAALIGNLAFLRAYIGFFTGSAFFLAALITQLICANSAFLAVSDGDMEDSELGIFKGKLILTAEKVIGLTLVLWAVTLPLAVLVGDAYLGLSANSFAEYGLVFGLSALLLCCLTCYFLNHSLLKKGVYSLDEKSEKAYCHNHKLQRSCGIVLAVLLSVTVLLNGSLTSWGNSSNIAKGTVFEDFESFKAYMEQDIPYEYDDAEPNAPVQISPAEYYDEEGNHISEEQALTRSITDANGNVLCSFVHRNNSVWSWRYSTTAIASITDSTNATVAGVLPITVYTQSDIDEARQKASLINTIATAACVIEIIAVLIVYLFKKKSPSA